MDGSHGKLCSFLHVDDNADEQFLVREIARLTELPFHIESMLSGESAVQYIAREGRFADELSYPFPAFLLLDYDLGITTGDHVTARIRKLARGLKLPIIIYTNSADSGDMMRSYRAGADHFLTKPAKLDRVKAVLRALYHCATANPPCYDPLAQLQEHSASSFGAVSGTAIRLRGPGSPSKPSAS